MKIKLPPQLNKMIKDETYTAEVNSTAQKLKDLCRLAEQVSLAIDELNSNPLIKTKEPREKEEHYASALDNYKKEAGVEANTFDKAISLVDSLLSTLIKDDQYAQDIKALNSIKRQLLEIQTQQVQQEEKKRLANPNTSQVPATSLAPLIPTTPWVSQKSSSSLPTTGSLSGYGQNLWSPQSSPKPRKEPLGSPENGKWARGQSLDGLSSSWSGSHWDFSNKRKSSRDSNDSSTPENVNNTTPRSSFSTN